MFQLVSVSIHCFIFCAVVTEHISDEVEFDTFDHVADFALKIVERVEFDFVVIGDARSTKWKFHKY